MQLLDNAAARIIVRGAVQGVGFRPFIYRLATDLGLVGWVNNSAQGVFIEVEGSREKLDIFMARIASEKPPLAQIDVLETVELAPIGFNEFEIRHSDATGEKSTLVLPDVATCSDCLQDTLDPTNRRYRYPFTNCTNCGPRFSIIDALPYDRPHTAMKSFALCPACSAEYKNPLDRRFHAQPNACPTCGPQLVLWDMDGTILHEKHDALLAAVQAIQTGKIVAIKGLGGFQLLVDAANNDAVQRLRVRKQRPHKPFAVMMRDLAMARDYCVISDQEAALLTSHAAPIVLLRSRKVLELVAPQNPYLGVMLPYTPLHHLLLQELNYPVVATSGNLSDEPICIDEHDALERLSGIADVLLVHNRPIVRHVDDSVVRVMADTPVIVRRARGYAPLPIRLKDVVPSVIAVGGHLKNTVAVSRGNNAFISQHIGDLATERSFHAFEQVIADFQRLFDLQPEAVVCDAHPDYVSSKYAETLGLPVFKVQHHEAHVWSCMAEHHLNPPVLGISWDGTGYGLDGTIWGGEFLRIHEQACERVAHLRPFPLPGGDAAVKEPRRSALGILYALYGDEALNLLSSFTDSEKTILRTALARQLNTPLTTSAGRLFDAVAALGGLQQTISFEGQAAMTLEYIRSESHEHYPFTILPSHVLDWAPMIKAIIADKGCIADMAARFHNTLVEMMLAIAQQVGEPQVVLTGGCFQNKHLLELAVERLTTAGFQPYWNQQVPTNDGGISLGQIAAYAHRERI